MNSISIFAHFDKKDIIQDYVVYYLKELKKVTDKIIFVSDSNIPQNELNKIKEYTDKIIAKKHGEYDFGSYKRGYLYLQENNLLNDCDELILCNDSCYGPLYPFKDMMDTMRQKDVDFWGCTANPGGCKIKTNNEFEKIEALHVQSFFLVFNNKIITSSIFDNFMKSIKHEEIKELVIINYEIGLSKLLINNGFNFEAYSHISKIIPGTFLFNYKQLITEDKMPLIKTSIFKENKHTADALAFVRTNTNYNVKLIYSDLKNKDIYVSPISQFLFYVQNIMGKYIFSIKIDEKKKHKILNVLGIKLKFKSKELIIEKRLELLENKYIELENKYLSLKKLFDENKSK